MATQVTNYQCPGCTGPLRFDGQSGRLVCDYCGGGYTVEEVEELFGPQNQRAGESVPEMEEWGPAGAKMRAYSCPSCGAELICEETTAATACPYCGNPTVVPGQFAGAKKPDCVIPFRLTREEAVELYANSPHEVAVHGARHLSLDEVDPAAATADVIKDRENLEQLFGRIIKGMAYANGSCSQKTAQILANCGIHYSRTTVSTECFSLPTDWLLMSATCHHENPRLMELAKKFVETENVSYHWTNRPMLFYLWGHSYEFNDKDNWHIIEDFAEYIGNRPDIWYATNGEIYDYVQAFDRLEYSADGKVIYNPTCTDLYLCYYGENVYVPGGQTVRL